MRDFRAWLRAVRVSVWRMRLRAEAVLAIGPSISHYDAATQGRVMGLRPSNARLAFYARGSGVSRWRRTTTGCWIGFHHPLFGSQHRHTAALGFLLGLDVDGNHNVSHLGFQSVFDAVAD